MNIVELRKKRMELNNKSSKNLKDINTIISESNRVAKVAHNSKEIITDLELEFESKTQLDSFDVKFLFLAIALQCTRQYLITPFIERVDDKMGAKSTKGISKEYSNRKHDLYNSSLQQIITNPVPFDAIFGSPDFNLNIGGGFNHRAKTLGHDPILGWIFGTMNIVTSTMTTWDFKSYHIKTGQTIIGDKRDKITNHAQTSNVIYYTSEKFLSGKDGRIKIATSLIKESIHLKSDINTHASLPLPFISSVSPELSRNLASYGLDMSNVLTFGKQASYSILINSLVGMIHGLYYDENKHSSWSIYEVKTRKILSYSNIIASSSNIIYVAIRSYLEDINAGKKLDMGGLIITIYRLLTDVNFIIKIKEEFLFGNFDKLIQGEEYNF